ncbi:MULTISPECIES: DUF5988 family protein [Micromonospora]|uniref:Nitrile hydratase beta subunit domain-containing protein n=1 Tax=Micromonospora antibiotica TaxID=2807623 RepID=A0ABS3VD85_9ACTN|nr:MULTISPECIES: DUF5988 family protein [Micromonospora]MBO4163580.1 hypothetical protein [Micromonospora antibiotica]MBW4705815.1 hypothetical protein [Micromonospora sp. RL09-050-HVF-A]
MDDLTRVSSARRFSDVRGGDHFDVVLEGGPVGLPATDRAHSAPVGTGRIKVPYLGGYEHFERSGDHDGLNDDASRVVVFQWTMRTKIAE